MRASILILMPLLGGCDVFYKNPTPDGDYCGSGDIPQSTFYADADGDGLGDPDASTLDCDVPSGFVDNGDDCDDTDPDVGAVGALWEDTDGDGWGGDPTDDGCPGEGSAAIEGDCDDASPDVYPGAAEACDGLDSDCDELSDDEDADVAGSVDWYVDGDGDGFGAGAPRSGCDPAGNEVDDATDCDDEDGAIHPGADEVCNELDDDCDEATDEADDDLVDGSLVYSDADGDGYGADASAELVCDPETGAILLGGDCEDEDAAVNPGASERCNELDDDCDGLEDDEDDDIVGGSSWYPDEDDDGYGDASAEVLIACAEPAGHEPDGSDCDDADDDVHPGATEVCEDGIDQDCDGLPTGCGVFAAADLDDATAVRTGADGAVAFGSSLAGMGDVDGDGDDEFIVGSEWDDEGAKNAGAVYVFEGPVTSTGTATHASGTMRSDVVSDYLGQVAGGGGDWDGDGVPDLAGGAKSAAYLVLGPLEDAIGLSDADVAVLIEVEGLAFIADWDGDGADELMASDDGATVTSSSNGAVYLLSGGGASSLATTDASATLFGEDEWAYAGSAIANAGDVDGDGVDDALIGAQQEDSWGAIYIALGPVMGEHDLSDVDIRLSYGSVGEHVGRAVAGRADCDGDGLADLALGAPAYAGSDGRVYLVLGDGLASGSLSDAYGIINGESTSEAGVSVALIEDFNGDGLGDLAFGAEEISTTVGGGGAVFLFLGAPSGTMDATDADLRLLGTSADGSAGAQLVAPGDLDGDGYSDLAVGASRTESGTGTVYILAGTGY